MDKIEKIRAEIERLKEPHEKDLNKRMERGRIGHAHGYVDCCDEILDFIDSLEEELSGTDRWSDLVPGRRRVQLPHLRS